MTMKFLSTWLCSLSCLLISTGMPAMAQDNDAETESDSGAKGLFFQQMESPNVAINTGVQYWIELHRDGEVIHANNKTQFRSGDAIRFHVKPNIDGYAYIVLREGSRGEQSQLFPDSGDKVENNRITHGREMVLPSGGSLVFDQNSGMEKLTLVISRKPIDAQAYVSGETKDSDKNHAAPQRIAMASSGSKDLVPNQVLVSYVGNGGGGYGASLKDMPAAQHQAAEKEKVALAGTSSLRPAKIQAEIPGTPAKISKENYSKDVTTKIAKTKPVVTASADIKPDTPVSAPVKKPTVKRVVATASSTKPAASTKKKANPSSSVVTVVYKNPDGVLAADISLEHI